MARKKKIQVQSKIGNKRLHHTSTLIIVAREDLDDDAAEIEEVKRAIARLREKQAAKKTKQAMRTKQAKKL